jgi:Domain of unknown function (DUF4136)
MKSWKVLIVLAGCFLAAVAASAQSVSMDYDKTANFAAFKTYAWMPGTPSGNQLMDQRIQDGVDQQLAAKGLKKIDDPSQADLDVAFYVALTSQTQISTTGMGGWGYGWGGYGGGMTTTSVNNIPIGHLIVDLGDSKTKKLVWRGNAHDNLASKPDKVAKQIQKSLEKMFKKYPPPSGK